MYYLSILYIDLFISILIEVINFFKYIFYSTNPFYASYKRPIFLKKVLKVR